MADLNERDAKLVQYLNEAHGKERELETALQAHIAMTTRAPYKKRLQQHLRETKAHAKAVERRIKKLGGDGTSRVGTAVGKAMAAAKGPMHAMRGSGEQEKMLKNAKTEYFNEHEEIATYLAIETLAEKVGDRETAKMARGIRREEERMAKFLEGQIKSLTGAVVQEEVPRDQRASRNGSAPRKRSSAPKRAKASSKRASTTATRKKAASKRGTTSKKASSRRRPAAARGGGGSRRKTR
jgi:ferritin-like metal-binding protein YciE